MAQIAQRQIQAAQGSSGSASTTFQTNALNYYNIGTDPISARCQALGQDPAGCAPPADVACNAGPGQAASTGGFNYCWRSSAFDPQLSAVYPQLGPAWDHFTSGAEARVGFTVSVPLLGQITQSRSGSASFARPCQQAGQSCHQ
jgi:hypothetical protein